MKTFLCALALVLASTGSAAREVMIKIGETRDQVGGKVSFDVTDRDGKKSVFVFVSDRTGIRTVGLSLSRDQLLRLRGLADETLAELDAAPPAPSAPPPAQ